MVITQKSARSLAALNKLVATDGRTPREQQDVALPLMIPLGMEIFDIFTQGSPQGALAKEEHIPPQGEPPTPSPRAWGESVSEC